MASLTPVAVLPRAGGRVGLRGRCASVRSGSDTHTRFYAPKLARPPNAVRTRASGPATTAPRLPETIAEALATVEAHLFKCGCDLYKATPEVTAAVRTMVASKRVDGMTTNEVLDCADGVWEVFDMPHVRKISTPLQVGFVPVRYTIAGRKLRSDVRFTVPAGYANAGRSGKGLGGGWLSAAGGVKMSTKRNDAVQLSFTSFWVAKDGDKPRDPPRSKLSSPELRLSPADEFVDTIGKSVFLPELANFPLHFFDNEKGLCVFEFQALESFVACKRVADAGTKF